jgi:hypothetical protein
MAAGVRLADWQAICPVTGKLDGVHWQTPQDTPRDAVFLPLASSAYLNAAHLQATEISEVGLVDDGADATLALGDKTVNSAD